MNSLGIPLDGKRVRRAGDDRVGLVYGGFGASTVTSGTALFVRFADGTTERWSGLDALELVEEAESSDSPAREVSGA